MTQRFLALSASRASIAVAGGRTVTADPTTLLCDVAEQDASFLGAWLNLGTVGTTEQRPALSAAQRGGRFLDLTVGKGIVWSGTAWIDPSTGSTV